MAERRSTYLFHYEQDFETAKNHLYREMYDDYNDSNRIYFYGFWGSCSQFDWDQCYRVDIYDECSDPLRASSILREHDGKYYETD